MTFKLTDEKDSITCKVIKEFDESGKFVSYKESGLRKELEEYQIEEEKLNKMGFASITLGNNILRVETVPLAIISMINYENME
mgnify:CR=1 FL=1